MQSYTLFIDDERLPVAEDDVIVRSVEEAKAYVIAHGVPHHVNFDHDLGDGPSGYDFACWLVERDLDGHGFPESWAVHSQNPIGASNILGVMDRYQKFRTEQQL